MTATSQIAEVQERMLTTVEAAQDRVLELNRAAAEAITGVLPTDRFRIPAFDAMPELPGPAELVESYFDFASRIAQANRNFATEMVTIWAPADEAPAAPAPQKAKATKATKKAKA